MKGGTGLESVQDRGWSTKRERERGREREREREGEERERERRGRGEGEGEGEERERSGNKEKETSLLFNCSSVIPLSTYSHHPLLSDDRGI